LWGILIIVIGLIFLLNNFNIFDMGDFFATFWPVILIIIGIKIILSRKKHEDPVQHLDVSPSSIDSLSESRFIGDVHMKIENEHFRGGSVSNFIGDVTLDLSDISLQEGEQSLTISGFIGDVTLIAPKHVAFMIHASVSLGDLVMFGQKDDGFGVSRDYVSQGYETADTRIKMNISYFIGDVKVL
jgi:lia operon protein LiaF